MKELLIPARSGLHLKLSAENRLKIVDVEGRQVVDFFAVSVDRPEEFFSPGATVDCNHSIKPTAGDLLYSSLYRPMFRIAADSVGEHDLLHPCCRPEMYDHFYGGGANHPSCYGNITTHLAALGLPVPPAIAPLNIFMHTKIKPDGTLEVLAPLSQPDDYIILEALMDAHVFLAACSVSESACNGGRCTPVKAAVYER